MKTSEAHPPGREPHPAARETRENSRSLRPLHIAILLVAIAVAGAVIGLPRRPTIPRELPPSAPAPVVHSGAPRFERFEVPTDRVKVRQVGEGIEIINTDPALTGREITIWGVTTDGGRISYTVTVPPPAGAGEGVAPRRE